MFNIHILKVIIHIVMKAQQRLLQAAGKDKIIPPTTKADDQKRKEQAIIQCFRFCKVLATVLRFTLPQQV